MSSDARLDELVLQWEACWEKGMFLEAEDLCSQDSPHLEPLRRRIRALLALAPVLDLEGATETPALPQLPGYDILEEIDRGGMGIVYRARDRVLHREVAVKILRPAIMSRPAAVRRFHREAQVLAQLAHENIVPIYEARLHHGRSFFVMQFVQGGCLAQHLKRYTDDPHAAVTLLEKVARAVQCAHEREILHRDLKPANILLDERGRALVSDFGLAKLLADTPKEDSLAPEDRGATWAAHSVGFAGTPPYMAPEQLADDVAITPAADIWAIGVILYETLTGRRPFTGKARELVRQIEQAEPPRPRTVQPSLDRDLEVIVLKCLRKQPERRYTSAQALADDLRRYLHGEPIQARHVGIWERASRRVRRQPVTTVALGVALLAMLALAGSYVWLTRINEKSDLERRRFAYVQKVPEAQRAWERQDFATLSTVLNGLRPPPGKPDLRGFEWHHLWKLYHDAGVRMIDHKEHVDSVAYAPDGRTLASGGNDALVRLWDPATGQLLARWLGHTGEIFQVAFAPDGRTLATASKDGTVRVWDVFTGQVRALLRGHEGGVACVAFAPDGRTLASGGLDGTIVFWDLVAGNVQRRCTGHTDHVRALAFSPDGATLASCGGTKLLCFWDVASGRSRTAIPLPESPLSLAFSPDGRWLAVGCDIDLHLHEASTGKRVADRRHAVEHIVNAVAFSPDGRNLVSASMHHVSSMGISNKHGEVCVWQHSPEPGSRQSPSTTVAPEAWARLEQSSGGFSSLTFAPDGRSVALGDMAGIIRMWNLPASSEPAPPMGHSPEECWSVAFSPDGTRLASGGDNEKSPECLRVWDVATRKTVWTSRGHEALVSCVAYAPDGTRLASGGYDHTARLWDAVAGRELAVLRGHTQPLRALAFSPDGRLLATGAQDHTVRLWDLATGMALATLTGHTENVRSVTFAAAGRLLLTAGTDGSVRIWDVARAQQLRELRDRSAVFCLTLTSDGRDLFTGHKDGRVLHWNLDSGQAHAVLSGHQQEVRALVLSPDGRTLASAGADATIRLWDPVTGTELLMLRGHKQAINGLDFSPRGDALASACHDGSINLWRAGER